MQSKVVVAIAFFQIFIGGLFWTFYTRPETQCPANRAPILIYKDRTPSPPPSEEKKNINDPVSPVEQQIGLPPLVIASIVTPNDEAAARTFVAMIHRTYQPETRYYGTEQSAQEFPDIILYTVGVSPQFQSEIRTFIGVTVIDLIQEFASFHQSHLHEKYVSSSYWIPTVVHHSLHMRGQVMYVDIRMLFTKKLPIELMSASQSFLGWQGNLTFESNCERKW
jgi:hypothetical protein